MIALYTIALFASTLAVFVYRQLNGKIGELPVLNVTAYMVYKIFVILSTIFWFIIFAYGVFIFSWWVPIVIYIVSSLMSAFVWCTQVGRIIGSNFVYLCFPISIFAFATTIIMEM